MDGPCSRSSSALLALVSTTGLVLEIAATILVAGSGRDFAQDDWPEVFLTFLN